jgi:hypothetical protein
MLGATLGEKDDSLRAFLNGDDMVSNRSKGHPFQGDFLEDFLELSKRAVELCERATRPGA